jgi:adenylate cyclase
MSRDVATINSIPMPSREIRAVVDWLIDGARSAPQPQQVLAELSERLAACGIPLWRVAVFVRTLHPNVMGRRFIWRPGAEIEVSEAPFELLETAEFRDNPIARVYETGRAIRRKLTDPDYVVDFPVLADLRAQGVTDYLASPLLFTDGAVHVVTCTTREPGGFTDTQIAGIEAIITPLARVAEIRALRRTASTLLDTYVGHDAGERILAGRIRVGDIEEIHAAIWLSDMRGFTALADGLPPRVLIDLLNRYFDCQVPAILDHGAEVLKFMGDGCWRFLRSLAMRPTCASVHSPRRARRRQTSRHFQIRPCRGCASAWRCTSAMFFTAISAAAIVSISPVLVPRSIVPHASKS